VSGRKTSIEAAYRVNIPGVRLRDEEGDTWTPFLMQANDLLELYHAIKTTLNLT